MVLEAWWSSPGNTGKPRKTKNGSLQNACPRFIAKPQCQAVFKLVSYKMVGLELPQTWYLSSFPGKHSTVFFPALFFQSPFLHCLKWSLNSVVKWLPRRHFVKKRPSYKRFAQQKARLLQNGMVQWAQVVTKCHLFKTHASETMTWVMPFHSGNAHGDDF